MFTERQGEIQKGETNVVGNGANTDRAVVGAVSGGGQGYQVGHQREKELGDYLERNGAMGAGMKPEVYVANLESSNE